MLFGMITQIFCGCVTGLVDIFSLHIFFRYLSAVCCAQMYTAGQMICKTIFQAHFFSSLEYLNLFFVYRYPLLLSLSLLASI